MTPEFAAAIIAAQAELPVIVKSGINPHYKSKYTTLDAVLDGAKPVLAKHKLAITQSSEPSEDGRAIFVRTTLIHASGELLTNSVWVVLGKLDPQGCGAALSYGRRYGLSALLCVVSDEDDDAESAMVRTSEPRGERGGRDGSPVARSSSVGESTSSPPAAPVRVRTAPVPCRICGGPQFDNRENKRYPS